MKIGIIGLGNLGNALAEGLSSAKVSVVAFDHNVAVNNISKSHFRSISFLSSVDGVIEQSDLILVCIRTDQVQKFLSDYIHNFISGKIVVFTQAGIKNDLLIKTFKGSEAIAMRAIPNINSASQNGFTFVLSTTDTAANRTAIDAFTLIGKVQMVDAESQLDCLSLLTGCTPALFATFWDAIIKSGVAIGVSKNEAERLIFDTMLQTLGNIMRMSLDPIEFKNRVCTSGGVVETAMKKLENETTFKDDIFRWLVEISASFN